MGMEACGSKYCFSLSVPLGFGVKEMEKEKCNNQAGEANSYHRTRSYGKNVSDVGKLRPPLLMLRIRDENFDPCAFVWRRWRGSRISLSRSARAHEIWRCQVSAGFTNRQSSRFGSLCRKGGPPRNWFNWIRIRQG